MKKKIIAMLFTIIGLALVIYFSFGLWISFQVDKIVNSSLDQMGIYNDNFSTVISQKNYKNLSYIMMGLGAENPDNISTPYFSNNHS